MQPIEKLELSFKELGYTPYTGRITFKRLSEVLDESEKLVCIIEGSVKTTVGLLVATDKRIFYLGNNLMDKQVMIQISYKSVSLLKFVKSKLPYSGTLEIITPASKIKLKACIPVLACLFIEKVRKLKKEKPEETVS